MKKENPSIEQINNFMERFGFDFNIKNKIEITQEQFRIDENVIYKELPKKNRKAFMRILKNLNLEEYPERFTFYANLFEKRLYTKNAQTGNIIIYKKYERTKRK